jgi:peptidoglycan/LPS O-acetylase OafA/YrhL
VAEAKDYRRGIDLLRFLAAFGIVWDHARAPYADFGYTALAVFLILTSFFALGSFDRAQANGTAGGFWALRARRILVPWLFWCAFYKGVQYWVADDPSAVPFLSDPFSLMLGSWIHLWFLPFVMIALIFVPPVARVVRTPMAMYGLAVVVIGVSMATGWLHRNSGWPEPWPQWWFSIPLFLYGVMVALGRRYGMVWLPIATALVASIATVAVEPGFASFIGSFTSGTPRLSTQVIGPGFAAIQMIVAALVFEAAWRLRIAGDWPTRLAGYAFGIYLLHPFFMLVAFKLFGAGVDRSMAALFTFFAAWVATWVIQRLPVMRGMV